MKVRIFCCGPPTSPKQSGDSSGKIAVGTEDERLAVAAEIRHHLRDESIPAYVIASGTKLTVSYRAARIEYAPDTFFQQQGDAGIERLAAAGLDTLIIEAKDSDGRTQQKEFPLAAYQAK